MTFSCFENLAECQPLSLRCKAGGWKHENVGHHPVADFSMGSLPAPVRKVLTTNKWNEKCLCSTFFPVSNYFFYFSRSSHGNEMLLHVTMNQFIMKQVFQNTLDFDIFSPLENGMLKCY